MTFDEAVGELAGETLDAGDVSRLILALHGDEDQDEVRWSVVHLIERIPSETDAYFGGLLSALDRAPANRFVELMLGRISNTQKIWPAVKGVFERLSNPASRKARIVSIRTIASGSEIWRDKLGAFCDMLEK